MSSKLKRSLVVLTEAHGRNGEYRPPKKDLPDCAAEPPSVEDMLDEVLTRQAQKLHFFRPSMFAGCDRANVFHYQMKPFHPQRQSPRMKKVLAIGEAYHQVIQKILADHPDWWFAPESRIYLRVAGAWVRGSCDGVLIRRSDLYRVAIEIKSISHDQFVKLNRPKPQHVKQAIIYTKLQGLEWVVFIYVDKNTHNVKEFAVRVTDTKGKQIWKWTLDRIRELKGYVDRKELPEYNAKTCDTSFCQFVDYCRQKGAPV